MIKSKFDLLTDVLILLWWNSLPLLAGRVSRALSLMLSEGLHLVVWPVVAAFTPLFVLVMGFLAGWQRFGGELVFTQSALILSLAIIFGFMGGQLGAMFAFGYAVADFLVYSHPALVNADLATHLQLRLALIMVYIALAMLATAIPLIVRLLRAQTPLPFQAFGNLRLLVDATFGGIVGGLLVFLYIQAVPMLIRPLFTWRGTVPPIDAIEPLQTQAWMFASLALIIGFLRILIEYAAAAIDGEIVKEYADCLDQKAPPAFVGEVHPILKLLVQAITGTLLVAGLLDLWSSTVILFIAWTAIGFVRSFLSQRIGIWPRLMNKLPVVVRLVAALSSAYFLSSEFLTDRLSGTSFQPLVWALLIALTCMAIVFPEVTTSNTVTIKTESKQGAKQ